MTVFLRKVGMGWMAAWLVCAALTVVSVAPAEAVPIAPPCGATITGTATLTADVGSLTSPCPGNGLVIGANNTTLDLAGFDIFGDGNLTEAHAGVRNDGYTGVTIRDGTFTPTPSNPRPDPTTNSRITGFNAGVLLSGTAGTFTPPCGSNNSVTGLVIVGNNGSTLSAFGDGIRIEDADCSVVTYNYVAGNGPFGATTLVGDSDYNTVEQNRIAGNATPTQENLQDIGVRLEVTVDGAPRNNTITMNEIIENGLDGVSIFSGASTWTDQAENNTISHNLIEGNRRNGVRLNSASGNRADNNTVHHNDVCGNGSDGIHVASQYNTITNNNASHALTQPNKHHGGGVPGGECVPNGVWNGPGVDIKDSNVSPVCGNNTYTANNFTTRDPECPVPPPAMPSATDAALDYSSFLGDTAADEGRAVAVSADGETAYVTGQTCSSAFPTTGAYDSSSNGACDAFVAKFDTTASGAASLLYATYLGGSGTDAGTGIAVDSGDEIYVTGQTCSTDFPAQGAYDTSSNGACDAFVAKLDTSLSGTAQLLYATFMGGSAADVGSGIAVSGTDAYLAGTTCSTNFPAVGAYDSSSNGACDAFVAKVATTLTGTSSLAYSTYLGGSGADTGTGVAVSAGKPYLTGQTCQSGALAFPTTASAHDIVTAAGACDAFVSKLDTSLGTTGLLYSSFLGGDPTGDPLNPADGDAYLVPDVVGTWPACINIGEDCHPDIPYVGSARAEAGADAGSAITVDGSGKAFVTGFTVTDNFPTKSSNVVGAYQKIRTGNCGKFLNGRSTTQPSRHMGDFQLFYQPKLPCPDAFVAKFDTASTGAASLVYSTYLGGSDHDAARAIAVDSGGNAYVTGVTFSGTGVALTSTSAYDGSCNEDLGCVHRPYPTTAGDRSCGTDVLGTCNSYTFEETRPETPTATPCKALQTLYCEEHNVYIPDAFVTMLSADGSSLGYSTFLGGSSDESGAGVGVGAAGATVTGKTCSTDFPTSVANSMAVPPTYGAYDSTAGACDGFVTRL